MLLRKILFASISIALVGCTGVLEPRGAGVGGGGGPITPEPPPTPPPDAGTVELFVNTVSPLLESKCAGCHAEGATFPPYFLTGSSDGYYDKVMQGYPNDTIINTTPDTSRIYAKGKTPHAPNNVVWEQTELDTIANWITAEATARSGGGATLDPTPEDNCGGAVPRGDCSLEKLGKCFTSSDWTALQPYQVANVQTDQGPCLNCHNDITNGGFFADGDSSAMYDEWKVLPSINKLVVASADGLGVLKSYRLRDKGGEVGDHPRYTLPTQLEQDINDFLDATLANFALGPCTDDVGP